jgi:biotin carboxyl carrier protein
VNLGALRRLASWMQEAKLHSIEITEPTVRLRMVCSSAPSMSVSASAAGDYFSTHPMRTAPFVERGDLVREGDILGLLCTGTIYRPVTAPCDGTVLTTIAGQAIGVNQGTVLFRLRPTSTCESLMKQAD